MLEKTPQLEADNVVAVGSFCLPGFFPATDDKNGQSGWPVPGLEGQVG